jgi:DNA-binding Xre family transcriptional regulator
MLSKAFKQARKAVESLYDCTCNITGGKEKIKDPITKETKLVTKVKHKDIKCRISKQSLSKNTQTDTVNQVVYELKLFICPELDINQGDIVEVTNKFGEKETYRAGEGFPYNTHQEVILSKEDKA